MPVPKESADMDGQTAHRPRADDHPAPRRRWFIVLVVVIVLGAATGAAALGLGGRHRPVAQAKVTLTSTAVTRCTLTDSQVFPGQTTFGAAHPVPVQSQGLITWLPRAGTVVREGQTLVRVNDRPVVLLHGSLPHYRALHAPAAQTTTAVTDGAKTSAPATPSGPTAVRPMRGADVRQLKRALTRLGYRGLGTGKDYTRSTAEVVKRWQRDLGENPTGTVQLGDVFYAGGPLRVVPGPEAAVGQPMSPAALRRTSRTLAVTATVDGTSTWVRPGVKLSIDTGPGGSVPAVVSSVKAGDTTGPDGSKNLDIVASVADQSALKSAGAAVTVTHVTARHADVLCVPSAALVALAEGGYGLEAEGGTYLPVQIGLFAQGKVEVRGAAIHDGLRILSPVGD
jgi:hypothetical protein